MSDHAIIAGSFADFKTVKTRSTAQLIIEIPIEQADAALAALGGVPQAGKENPVAIARLDPNAATTPVEPPSTAPEKPKGGRLAQQAGIVSGDARFRQFLKEAYPSHCRWTDDGFIDAAGTIRALCEVDSRADFDANPKAGSSWQMLHGEYIAWMNAP